MTAFITAFTIPGLCVGCSRQMNSPGTAAMIRAAERAELHYVRVVT